LLNVATRKTSAGVTITGFNIDPLDQSLEEQHRFSLSGKSSFQYVILALAVIVPLFSLYALVLCVRTPFKGRKWPWVIFILMGIGKVAVNWTTDSWGVSLLSFQLLGASVSAQFCGPWIIAVSVPLGAILFLIKRNKLRAVEDGGQLMDEKAHEVPGVSPKTEPHSKSIDCFLEMTGYAVGSNTRCELTGAGHTLLAMLLALLFLVRR
jgi:hypothetical protein